jgi:hypothetical protein
LNKSGISPFHHIQVVVKKMIFRIDLEPCF